MGAILSGAIRPNLIHAGRTWEIIQVTAFPNSVATFMLACKARTPLFGKFRVTRVSFVLDLAFGEASLGRTRPCQASPGRSQKSLGRCLGTSQGSRGHPMLALIPRL